MMKRCLVLGAWCLVLGGCCSECRAANYGSLVGGELVRAPYSVYLGGATRRVADLTEAAANSAGWRLVVDERPALSSNEYAAAVGWTNDANRIRRVYEVRRTEPPPPTYRVAELLFQLFLAGKGEAAVALLKSQNLYEVALAQGTVRGDDPNFGTVLAAAKRELKITDEEAARILEAAKE